MLHREMLYMGLVLPTVTRWRMVVVVVVKILYVTFFTEHAAQWGALYRISSLYCHQRAGWWWKSSMWDIFSEHNAQAADTHSIGSLHCHQKVFWWWKWSISPFLRVHCISITCPTVIRGQIACGYPLSDLFHRAHSTVDWKVQQKFLHWRQMEGWCVEIDSFLKLLKKEEFHEW